MARIYDRLAKEALMGVLRAVSRELISERELAPDAQRLDLWCTPEPSKLEALAPFGLLQRIAAEGPCAFEFFHQAPSLHEILSSLRKAFYLRQLAQLPPREDEPWLWIIAGGRPNQVLKPLGFRAEAGWPQGVCAGPPGLRVRLVVTSELPRTPETLLLRILGAGKTLRLAKNELQEKGLEDPVGAVVLPLMVRLHLERLDHPGRPIDPETEQFLMETNDIYERWQKKFRAEGEAAGRAEGEAAGRAEGVARALLAVLAARDLSVTAEQADAIRSCRDLEQLEAWLGRAVSAVSAEDVLRSS